jgi:hypothetical protein
MSCYDLSQPDLFSRDVLDSNISNNDKESSTADIFVKEEMKLILGYKRSVLHSAVFTALALRGRLFPIPTEIHM